MFPSFKRMESVSMRADLITKAELICGFNQIVKRLKNKTIAFYPDNRFISTLLNRKILFITENDLGELFDDINKQRTAFSGSLNALFETPAKLVILSFP